jgi:hypothetical protein
VIPKTLVLPAAALIVPALFLATCSGYDATAVTRVTGPPFGDGGADFRPVSAVVERRCGTLDCHGQIVRPLLIYGQYGLRLDGGTADDGGGDDGGAEGGANGGDYPGGLLPTTPAELIANFQSMCGLEPEILGQVVAGQAPPEALTLVRKPRLAEKHKGGLVWNKGDDGDVCMVSWLMGMTDTMTCATELMHP